MEDAGEDESIPSLQSDYSTEDEERDGVAGPLFIWKMELCNWL